MATSKAAVADADGAGGMQFAPVEMKAARDKLDRAGVAMTAKDHALAQSLAEASQVDAQLAEAKAHAGKARAAADAVRADGRVLRNELDRRAK